MAYMMKTFGIALTAGLLGSVAAQASTIDLTDNGTYTQTTTSASGTTADNVSWVIKPIPAQGPLTYTNFDGNSLAANKALNPDLAFENDGIGIKDDEVSYPSESLTMTFDQSVTVTGVYVLDLFGAETTEIYSNGVLVGTIAALSGATNSTDDNSTDGYSYIKFSTGVTTTSLTFKAGPKNDTPKAFGSPDFALAAITLAPIPVPAAGLLLLGGLGALGAAKKRRKTA